MLVNKKEDLKPINDIKSRRIISTSICLTLLSLLIRVDLTNVWSLSSPQNSIGEESTIRIGEHLFSEYLLPFEVASVLLLMAMIGGMTGVLHDVIPYGLSTGNRNSLQGLNLIGLRRAKFENKDILGLSEAYKEIFATKNINENISKLNGSFQENPLVKEVIEFITKDKKRSICTPFS